MDLPPDLRAALTAELGAIAPRRLARASAAIVERYRGGQPAASGRFLETDEDLAAYAAYRMPATYAAVLAALSAVDELWPDEPPRSLLDIGAGPGTALWAAHAVWPSLSEALLLEQDARMIALGRRLAAHADAAAVRDARWRQADVLGAWDAPRHDLVVAAYVLNELPEERRAACVAVLWAKTAGALVIVEPGTPAGYERVIAARAQLIEAGGTVVAPCPHDRACPLLGHDWCHFAQRVSRSRLHRAAKGAELSYEDEKYSYVAVSRLAGAPIAGRVIRRPQILPGRVVLQLCAPDGLRTDTLTRGKDRAGFRMARDLRWGDAMQVSDSEGDL